MTFAYFDDLDTDRDKIRLRIGDTVENSGPRPDKRNFSNAEITFILSEEGSVVNAAIAHAFEILAAEWTAYALSETQGQASYDAKEVAENFRKQAMVWRAKPGGASETAQSSYLISLERDDAYTDLSEYVT